MLILAVGDSHVEHLIDYLAEICLQDRAGEQDLWTLEISLAKFPVSAKDLLTIECDLLELMPMKAGKETVPTASAWRLPEPRTHRPRSRLVSLLPAYVLQLIQTI